MYKIILFILLFISLLSAQQLNYIYGTNASGAALTGSFTSLDSTGGTSYTMVFTLDDFYPFDFNPFYLVDSTGSVANSGASAQGSADKMSIGTWWYFIDADAATDSTNFDIDVYTGVYGTVSQSIAGVKWDLTPTNCADITGINDLCGGVFIYTETGKNLPPHVIKIVIDVDPTASEVSAGLDVYYELVYPAIYQVAKERK